MEQSCPDCEAHTRKSITEDGEEEFYSFHECRGVWGWHALIRYGDGSPPVPRYLGGPRSAEAAVKGQLSMLLTALKARGYANVEFKMWWGQQFEEESESEGRYMEWASPDSLVG
jgi:hypothetical protein